MISTSTLRPGYLVALSTRVSGNTSYIKTEIEPDHRTETGALQGRWETERTISDPEEHELAVKTRGRCRTIVTSVCAQSDFGLLCPASSFERLGNAVEEARALAADFNRNARLTKIEVFVITGRVADNDVEAVKSINAEVTSLLDKMERGLQTLDVQAIRDAANRARNLGSMLSPDASERVKTAIATARSAARRIVKAAEEGVAEVDQAAIRKIADSRTAFLDLEDGAEMVAPEVEGRAIDLVPEAQEEAAHAAPATPDIDIGTTLPADIENHPALCQCAACEAAYGIAPVAPRTVPAIELD